MKKSLNFGKRNFLLISLFIFLIQNSQVTSLDEQNNLNDDDTLDFGVINEIEIQSLPWKKYVKLPYDKEKVLDSFLLNVNLKTSNIQNDLEIKYKITNKIGKDTTDGEVRSDRFDKSTKSVAAPIDNAFVTKNWEAIKDKDADDVPILFIQINDRLGKDIDSTKAKIFVIYNNHTDYVIEENNYINDKLNLKGVEAKYKYYHLQLKENNDRFYVDFSSNYALNRRLYISFIDKEKINPANALDLKNNSTDVEFIESKTKKGSTYHFEFSLKNNKKDIYLCVLTTIRPKEQSKDNSTTVDKSLPSLNYIFKYFTYNSGKTDDIYKYELNDEVKYSSSNDKTTIEINNVKIMKGTSEVTKDWKLYVRKIKDSEIYLKEYVNTIGIIASNNELIPSNYENSGNNIKITVPKINDETEHYSILIEFEEENEKFVYNTIHTPKISKPIVQLVLLFVGAPLLLAVIIIIIVVIYKHKQRNLKDEVMAISFVGDRQIAKEEEGE